jgi:pSer/pThr/pTyr-binding forkhead associated (FHA) protein
MRFRLRYLQHDLELTEGTFAVGRNASCQLSLDDPLVSRRHALLDVTKTAVTIEDLSSRNGVIVNGQRIQGKVLLAVGDRIIIGEQELTLFASRDSKNLRTGRGKMTLPQVRLDDVSNVGTQAPPPEDQEPSVARRADQFKLLSAVAEKAFAMGKAGEAERLLASALADIIEATRAGRSLPPTLVDQAAKFSAKLATATGKGGWADYVIELYAAQKRPCPAYVTDELYKAMRKVASVDLQRLHDYVQMLRQNVPRYGPAERFLFQRIEGLERLAALL